MNPSSSAPALRRRLSDLASFQLPRLRDCRGPLSAHAELADELRLDLESVRKGLEVLQEEIEVGLGSVYTGGGDEARRAEYEDLEKDYRRLRVEYRSAVVSSKRQIASSSSSGSTRLQSAKDPLAGTSASQVDSDSTAGPATYPPRTVDDPDFSRERGRDRGRGRGQDGDDAVQTKTNEVTDALRRTLGTMQVELERSVLSVQMLDESTRTLRSTSNLYDTYSTVLHTSSQLVKALERADWYDRLVIGLAFLLFLLTVGWVIKRRVFDKVVGGVGWWVGGSWKLVRMGFGAGPGSASKVAELGKAAAKEALDPPQSARGKAVLETAGDALKLAASATGVVTAAAGSIATAAASASGAAVSLGQTGLPPLERPTAPLSIAGSKAGGRHDEL